ANAEMVVQPSLYEGFGFPVLEAMAAGTPVICSNVSSLPEIAGDAAVLVAPRNVKEIGKAILSVYGNKELSKTLINKGFERIKKFTWLQCAEKTLQVYKKVSEVDNA
ncbi:MAG: glycosyltransferase, partial [Planctomycetota bacterium]